MDARLRELERRWWEDGDAAADDYDQACRRIGESSPPRRQAGEQLLGALDRFARTVPLPWPIGTDPKLVAAEVYDWLNNGGEPLVLIGGLRAQSTHDATLSFTSAGPVVLLGPDVLFAQPPRPYYHDLLLDDPYLDPMIANSVSVILGPWTVEARGNVHQAWRVEPDHPAAGMGYHCLRTLNGWWYAWSRRHVMQPPDLTDATPYYAPGQALHDTPALPTQANW